jgi:hypothetical protein
MSEAGHCARRVDEKLTDWRDALPLVRPGQNRETPHVAMAAPRVAVTRRFELADPLFDAEEVRGSNPLAPTRKGPGDRAFSLERPAGSEAQTAQKLTKS